MTAEDSNSAKQSTSNAAVSTNNKGTATSSSRRRGGGRARQRQSKRNNNNAGNNKGKQQQRNNKTTVPPSPQLKVTIRNIQDASQNGTVESILQSLLPKLLEKSAESIKSGNNSSLLFAWDVDRQAVRKLLQEETAAKEYQAKEQARMETQKQTQKDGDNNENNETAAVSEVTDGSPIVEENVNKQVDTAKAELDVVIAPKASNCFPTIMVQPLYVVPPRKSKRYGERAGVAYVLLIAPKVTDESINKGIAADIDKNGHGQVAEPLDKSATPAAATSAKPTAVDYTRQLAKCSLLLNSALETLQSTAHADSKTQNHFSGCMIELSPNQKAWKVGGGGGGGGGGFRRPFRREGTIESSQEFKQWLEWTAQQKEVLKARPKPAPGGGVASSATTAEGGAENGESLAALVQHLLAKKQELKRKKALSKKRKAKKPETSATTSAPAAVSTKGKGRGGKKDGDGAKKQRKAKKNKPHAKKGSSVAPTALLKPPASNS
jgi:hypothetical protein